MRGLNEPIYKEQGLAHSVCEINGKNAGHMGGVSTKGVKPELGWGGADPHSWQQGPRPMREVQPGPAEEPAETELGFRSKANPGEPDADETSRRGPRAGITVPPGT